MAEVDWVLCREWFFKPLKLDNARRKLKTLVADLEGGKRVLANHESFGLILLLIG